MLYHWHELHTTAMTPARMMAEAGMRFFRSPYNPFSYTPGARVATAALDVVGDTGRVLSKPAWRLGSVIVDGVATPVHERVLAETPFCSLREFARDGAENAPRLLIVAPLSGHFATLLRGTVQAMLAGHRVAITDWRNARDTPLAEGNFDLDDYIDYVIDCLRHLGPETHVLAVCQPSVPVLAAVALMSAAKDPCAPRSMILMGGPIDSRLSPTVPNRLAQEHSLDWFERHAITRVPLPYAGFMRRVYPGFLQLTGFMSMNLDRHVGAHVQLFRHLVRGDGEGERGHRAFYDEYRAVMDLPAEYYLQTVQRVFQEHQLPRGVMASRGRPIDASAIARTALMTVEGERDDISGLGQTHAAHALCSRIPAARRAQYTQGGVGHYGVFNGRRWRDEIAPRVAAFIRAHDRG